VAIVLASATAGAEESSLLPENFRDATVPEAAAFLVLGGGAVVTNAIAHGPETPHWTGGILLDERMRDAIRASGDTARAHAARVSDVLVATLVSAPYIDAAVTAWWVHGDSKAAVQLAIMDAEAHAISSTLVLGAKLAVGRQRPWAYEAKCDTPAAGPECSSNDRNVSFFSGHSVLAFTSASLLCTEHAHIPLYGGAWDTIACITALSAATTTATLRMVADKHWLSDVVVGTTIGLFTGWAVPTFMHFRGEKTPSKGIAWMPTATPSTVGLGLQVGVAGIVL
jgi:membrane-associated phospholipid phosphatase